MSTKLIGYVVYKKLQIFCYDFLQVCVVANILIHTFDLVK